MKKVLSNDYLTMLCRLVFGLVFIYASLDKISQPEQFARIVYNYHLLPGSLVNIWALILPISEFAAGLFLIFGFMYEGSRLYLGGLLVLFLIAISVNIIRGVDLECGCFTVSSRAKTHGYELIIRDLIFLIPGIILFISSSRRWCLDNLICRKH